MDTCIYGFGCIDVIVIYGHRVQNWIFDDIWLQSCHRITNRIFGVEVVIEFKMGCVAWREVVIKFKMGDVS